MRIHPLKKTPKDEAETSPHSYNSDVAKMKMGQASPRYSYGKEKGKSFIQAYEKSKKWVPSPHAYNTEKAFAKITIGARRGYK